MVTAWYLCFSKTFASCGVVRRATRRGCRCGAEHRHRSVATVLALRTLLDCRVVWSEKRPSAFWCAAAAARAAAAALAAGADDSAAALAASPPIAAMNRHGNRRLIQQVSERAQWRNLRPAGSRGIPPEVQPQAPRPIYRGFPQMIRFPSAVFLSVFSGVYSYLPDQVVTACVLGDGSRLPAESLQTSVCATASCRNLPVTTILPQARPHRNAPSPPSPLLLPSSH